jgi:hypothetical protein
MKITSVIFRLQTTRRDPFSDWVTSVDEFFRRRTPFESMLILSAQALALFRVLLIE